MNEFDNSGTVRGHFRRFWPEKSWILVRNPYHWYALWDPGFPGAGFPAELRYSSFQVEGPCGLSSIVTPSSLRWSRIASATEKLRSRRACSRSTSLS